MSEKQKQYLAKYRAKNKEALLIYNRVRMRIKRSDPSYREKDRIISYKSKVKCDELRKLNGISV